MVDKKSNRSICAVTAGKVDLTKYDKLDHNWRNLGIAAPARRALIDANLLKLKDLQKIRLSDLAQLHGMGPKAIEILVRAGASFKE